MATDAFSDRWEPKALGSNEMKEWPDSEQDNSLFYNAQQYFNMK